MAEDESSETTIIEERVELMVDPTTSEAEQIPAKRTGHFLKPSLNLNALPPKFPKIQSFSSSSKPNVLFLCQSTPLKGWQTWVEKLGETHEPAWRKAGIFDAIKSSTCYLKKSTDLIFSLVKKWCPETNTFVFPWGEATVTLEDVYILGGFSPLGVSVSCGSSCLEENVEQVKRKLMKLYGKLKDKDNNHVYQLRWLEHLMGRGNQIEYAGFLALWLGRHVFPSKNNGLIVQKVFAIAAMISCGAKLAFGPVILASIYRDLTFMKRELVGPLSSHCRGGGPLKLSSPLHLVQVWAWERFPSLGPVPKMIHSGGIRLGRWECHVSNFYYDNDAIEMCLDSARETFRWRPYSMSIENWSLPRFYVNSGMWVVTDSDEEWELFAGFFMVGQLSGLDSVQNYNPHRVALQFVFDQDIPNSVDICYTLDELGYRMNLKGLKLYLPPRLHEGDITYRYFDWWRTRLDVQEVSLVGCKRKKRTGKTVSKMAKIFDTSNELEAIVAENVGEKSMEKSPPGDEFSPNLLQVGNDIGMGCLSMKCMLTSQEATGMEEDDEDELWPTNRSMGECSKINISCSKLVETEQSRSIDQEEGGMELAEMLLERKQGSAAMNSLGSQLASSHQNLDNGIGQVMVRCPLIRSVGDSGKCKGVAREQNKERNMEYLKANILRIGTPTDSNGALITVASDDAPDEALHQVAASLPVADNCDNPFAALCLEYESRISRLERVF